VGPHKFVFVLEDTDGSGNRFLQVWIEFGGKVGQYYVPQAIAFKS
jgi:hypothetical protein